MSIVKIELSKKELTTYILVISENDLHEYVYQLSNLDEFKHKVETYPHTNTLTITPRYGKETITAKYGDAVVWNEFVVGVIPGSEITKTILNELPNTNSSVGVSDE